MVRFRELLLGILLITFVVGTTVTSIWWPNPSWQPADESGSVLLLSEPAPQTAPAQPDYRAWRDDFSVAYWAITALLTLVAGLMCVAACFRRYFSVDKITHLLHKTGRTHFS